MEHKKACAFYQPFDQQISSVSDVFGLCCYCYFAKTEHKYLNLNNNLPALLKMEEVQRPKILSSYRNILLFSF